jgi:hypothetical protein
VAFGIGSCRWIMGCRRHEIVRDGTECGDGSQAAGDLLRDQLLAEDTCSGGPGGLARADEVIE